MGLCFGFVCLLFTFWVVLWCNSFDLFVSWVPICWGFVVMVALLICCGLLVISVIVIMLGVVYLCFLFKCLI